MESKALKDMQAAANEIAAEFIQHKRAVDWGIVNDAYLQTSRLLRKAATGTEV